MSEVHDYASASKHVDVALQNLIGALERLATARAYASGSQAQAPAYGRTAAAQARKKVEAGSAALNDALAALSEYRPKEADHG